MYTHLSAEEKERNELLARVYKNPVVDHILIWGSKKYPDFLGSFIKEDFKQEIFLLLAQKPISWLIDLESNGKILGFISSMVKKESALVWRKFLATDFEDYNEDTHGECLTETPNFNLSTIDLYDSCTKELNTVPYTERKGFQLFSETFNEGAVWESLKESGIQLSRSKCIGNLKQTRDTIQRNLLAKGIIEKKVEFSLTRRFFNLTGRYHYSILRTGAMMRTLVNLLGQDYDTEMPWTQKVLHAFIHYKNPLSSLDFYDYLNENEVVNSSGEAIIRIKKKFTNEVLNLLAAGLCYSERTEGYTSAPSRKQYFIRKEVFDYVKKLLQSGLPLNREQSNKWQIYNLRQRNFHTFEHISEEIKIPICDVVRLHNEAQDFVGELNRARE